MNITDFGDGGLDTVTVATGSTLAATVTTNYTATGHTVLNSTMASASSLLQTASLSIWALY